MAKEATADFRAKYGPRALILGGSEGIGAAYAEQLAERGLDITLVARSEGNLKTQAEKLRGDFGVDVVVRALDLTAPDFVDRAASLIAEFDYGLVIYNAGATHGSGLFLDEPLDKALNLVSLNCVGPLAIAHHALRPMRERGRGGLILLSSMAALVGSGYVAAYSATKSFDLILAEGLHWEMARSGVDVLCTVATLTDTPAMVRSGMRLNASPDHSPMNPRDVALESLNALGNHPVWYAPGDEVVEAMRLAPRTSVTDQMSRTSALLYGIEIDTDPQT